MTPKEKAIELFGNFRFTLSLPNAPLREMKDLIAKQCALIAVEEIIKEHYPQDAKRCEYWNQVKTEIQKL